MLSKDSFNTMIFIKAGPIDGEETIKQLDSTKKQWFYIKTWKQNAESHKKKYKWAFEHGIGAPIKEKYNGVIMPEGLELAQAVKKKCTTLEKVAFNLNLLRLLLEKNERAHCDVKYENCLYFSEYGVRLIDNGDIKTYGDRRMVKSQGQNSTLLVAGQISGLAGPGTDQNGYDQVMKRLKEELANLQ